MVNAAYVIVAFPLLGFIVNLVVGPAPRRADGGLGGHAGRWGLFRLHAHRLGHGPRAGPPPHAST